MSLTGIEGPCSSLVDRGTPCLTWELSDSLGMTEGLHTFLGGRENWAHLGAEGQHTFLVACCISFEEQQCGVGLEPQ